MCNTSPLPSVLRICFGTKGWDCKLASSASSRDNIMNSTPLLEAFCCLANIPLRAHLQPRLLLTRASTSVVLEAAEPNGPLQLARTLFLSSGGAATRLRCFDWDGNETQEQDDNRLSRGGRCVGVVSCAKVAQSW